MVAELNFHIHSNFDLNLPLYQNGYMPDWQGHTVALAATLAASVVAVNMISTLIFGGQETVRQISEPSCFNLFGYEVFCWQKTCYETSCSYWDSLWNNCIPEKVCYSFYK